MTYKIAVSSSDGINIDLSFGETEKFLIYEVQGLNYNLSAVRECDLTDNSTVSCGSEDFGCGSKTHCGERAAKTTLISDCRCIVCKKIGFHIQKQLERLAVTGFDVECTVGEALDKITAYFDKTDRHESLRVQ
ncbi:MAG: hypothetical protein LUC97_05145 [Clostridiales bacterium]|nr:hypothetical protein [Clostridiales bacterium]